MKLAITATLALALFAAGPVFAVDPPTSTAKPLTPQQQKMKDCNAQATGKTGDERSAFMSTCLKGGATEPVKPMTQQEKMTACNAKATGKTGDERKAFMSSCLKADASAEPAKPMTQQEKMTACNAKATGKTGDDRKAFMSQCLKADATTPASH